MSGQAEHKWTFRRLGGLDQVVLNSAEDFCRLRELDPKIWVALSCPTSGLEFDDRTLELIDTDNDGRIRIPEVLAAVEWTCSLLKDPAVLKEGRDLLPLAAVRDDTEAGRRILATMHAIMVNLGKPEATGLTRLDTRQALADTAEHVFNGDGVLPPLDGVEADVRGFIKDVMLVVGGVKDAGGGYGVNRPLADAFMQLLRDWKDWEAGVDAAAGPLGRETAPAWKYLQEIKVKVDDYFLRAELAAYAPQAQAALNVDKEFVAPQVNGLLSLPALADLPLAQVGPDRPLNLESGLNPEWRDKVERFAATVRPLLKNPTQLSRADWLEIQSTFEPYAAALARKPQRPALKVDLEPTGFIEDLDPKRIDELLGGAVKAKFDKLAEEDGDMPASAGDIRSVDRLVHYHQYLYRLLMNYVSFLDFYVGDPKAAFQVGTLYIDGRSCDLCLPVDDVAAHSVLAAHANLFLIYCKCVRKEAPGRGGAPESKTIVAAVTAGDSDLLIDKRNGVFVDAAGQDWDATVVKVNTNPISIRQAMLDPYRRFGRMITDQINKFASSKDADLTAAAGKRLGAAEADAQSGGAAPKFDIGRNVGIFAAVGLALGAIGTALGSLAAAVFSLSWWQFPLLILGLFLLISGPSMIMAWLKLRKRTLGPLLEASGWAVNGKVFINFVLGGRLTSTATLPPGAGRAYADPYGKNSKAPWLVFGLAALAGAAAVAFWLWHKGYFKGLFGA